MAARDNPDDLLPLSQLLQMESSSAFRSSMGGNEEEKTDTVYKMKVANFLGRPVPIILQNDNGPCPLIAICNVLLLRNNVTLNKEASEISLQNLLTLVAERLLDSNSNNENKDENYIQNQQQNISDAISLLPRLATGIDVNVRFRNIHDFEFTPECAIFDLLDIDLVHGWLYDPQDENTSRAVGSNSYNVLVEKVVALHSEKRDVEEEPTVDFAAATTASLGVPSPGLCSRKSFESLQFLDFDEHKLLESVDSAEFKRTRKGDEEEARQLLEALNLSKEGECENSEAGPSQADVRTTETLEERNSNPFLGDHLRSEDSEPRTAVSEDSKPCAIDCGDNDVKLSETKVKETGASVGEDVEHDIESSPTSGQVSTLSDFECLEVDECRTADSSSLVEADSDFVEAGKVESATGESIDGRVNMEEPLYEGEGETFENREPLYEGEAVLQDSVSGRNAETEALTIENFLSSHASQLTYYGLFSLQEGLKERELCVFFRNNHFSTMFKYEGDLFLLVTDQGYLNEPDVVWEKLTEVDGDSVFYTGNFTLFKVDEHNSSSWSERDAVAATADYISSQMPAQQDTGDANYNSDLQLAMALQQQEFDQSQGQAQTQGQGQGQGQSQAQAQARSQSQQHQQQSPRKHSNSPRKRTSISAGKLFTGPSSGPAPKQDHKKDKCRVM